MLRFSLHCFVLSALWCGAAGIEIATAAWPEDIRIAYAMVTGTLVVGHALGWRPTAALAALWARRVANRTQSRMHGYSSAARRYSGYRRVK